MLVFWMLRHSFTQGEFNFVTLFTNDHSVLGEYIIENIFLKLKCLKFLVEHCE